MIDRVSPTLISSSESNYSGCLLFLNPSAILQLYQMDQKSPSFTATRNSMIVFSFSTISFCRCIHSLLYNQSTILLS